MYSILDNQIERLHFKITNYFFNPCCNFYGSNFLKKWGLIISQIDPKFTICTPK